MKLYLLILMIFCTFAGHAQVKDNNKTRQIEQLQHLKQTITRKIDSLQIQLLDQAASIEDARKKLDQLKKEYNRDKPDPVSKDQISTVSLRILYTSSFADSLQKTFDIRLISLDKALNLQKDLDDKISALVKESNR